jgi:DNA-directed RNA polymerase subunit RPC12/RpoP
MTIVCTMCNKRMHPNSAVTAIEMADFGPYKLWHADEYECDKCGTRVLAGFAQRAYAEHFQSRFPELLKQAEANGAARF